MKPASLSEIESIAAKLHANNKPWHFHIMSPSCKFNPTDSYAFVLEDTEASENYAFYSDKAEKELGQKLAPLLHGAKILDKQQTDDSWDPSNTVKQMLAHIEKLNQEGAEWHHHVLFPQCALNPNAPKFTLVLEGTEVFESVTDTEPTNVLKRIEKLFYKV